MVFLRFIVPTFYIKPSRWMVIMNHDLILYKEPLTLVSLWCLPCWLPRLLPPSLTWRWIPAALQVPAVRGGRREGSAMELLWKAAVAVAAAGCCTTVDASFDFGANQRIFSKMQSAAEPGFRARGLSFPSSSSLLSFLLLPPQNL